METQVGAIAAAMQSLKTAVQTVEASPEADSAHTASAEAHKTTLGLLEHVFLLINTITAFVKQPQVTQPFPPKPL